MPNPKRSRAAKKAARTRKRRAASGGRSRGSVVGSSAVEAQERANGFVKGFGFYR